MFIAHVHRDDCVLRLLHLVGGRAIERDQSVVDSVDSVDIVDSLTR